MQYFTYYYLMIMMFVNLVQFGMILGTIATSKPKLSGILVNVLSMGSCCLAFFYFPKGV